MHFQGREERSGILLRKGTRCASEDEILAKVSTHREFVPIEQMDDFATRSKYQTLAHSHGFYTIGVLTDASPLMTSRNGKKFGIFKITDLVKYDLNKVK